MLGTKRSGMLIELQLPVFPNRSIPMSGTDFDGYEPTLSVAPVNIGFKTVLGRLLNLISRQSQTVE